MTKREIRNQRKDLIGKLSTASYITLAPLPETHEIISRKRGCYLKTVSKFPPADEVERKRIEDSLRNIEEQFVPIYYRWPKGEPFPLVNSYRN